MTPESLRAWGRVFRDFVIVGVGAFMLIHETVASRSPNYLIISAGLVALGLPPVLRLDERRQKGDGS